MQDSDMTISLISFNTLGVPVMSRSLTERYVALANMIKETDANVLAFQEVHTYVHLQILKKLLKNEFPYVIYQKFMYGPKGGVVTFSKLPLESVGFSRFSNHGSFRNITFYGRLIRNGTLVCKIKGCPIFILNTYLTTNPAANWDKMNLQAKIQETQVRDIAQIVTVLKENNSAVVVAGDFNFPKASAAYRLFADLTNANDTFDNFSIPTYIFNTKLYLFHSKKSERVDYIFLIKGKQNIKIKKTDHVFNEEVRLFTGKKRFLSDHIGLYTKLEFKV